MNDSEEEQADENSTVGKPWVTYPEGLQEEVWPYCTIRHFPPAGNRLRVSQVELQPGSPAPVIRHDRSTELTRIIEGEALVYLDGKTHIEKTDSTFFIPPGTAHGFKAIDGVCHLLVIHVPAVPPNEDHAVLSEDFDLSSRP